MAQLSLAEWDTLLLEARATNLASRLAVIVDERDCLHQLPPQVQPHLVSWLRLAQHQSQAIARECRYIDEAMAPTGLPVVLLKGAAYALAGRKAAQGRTFGDVDILVSRAQTDAVEAALMLHGWSKGAIDPYDDMYYRRWMHELPPMSHTGRGTMIDVHHNILPLTAKHVPRIELLLADRQRVPGQPFFVLAPVDMMLHSAVHLFHEGQLTNGLRDLADLDSLVREFTAADPEFLDRALERAKILGLVWPLDLALTLCAWVFKTPVPKALADAARSASGLSGPHRQLLLWAYVRALRPQAPPAHGWQVAVARAYLYVRAHALRMPLGRLVMHLTRKLFIRLVKNSSRSSQSD